MSRILVLYSSYDGQTARIAERIGQVLGRAGHDVRVRTADAAWGDDVAASGEIAASDAVLIGGAIRYGHYSPDLVDLVHECSGALADRPNGFFSVCLSAGGPGARPATARKYVEDFCRKTGWEPREVTSFAGALRYREYGFFIRFMMRLIVGMCGGDTDTSRNYEYTDWAAVDRYAEAFAARLAVPAAA